MLCRQVHNKHEHTEGSERTATVGPYREPGVCPRSTCYRGATPAGDRPQDWRATIPKNGGHQPNDWQAAYFFNQAVVVTSSWSQSRSALA